MTPEFESFIQSFFEFSDILELPFNGTSMMPTISPGCNIKIRPVTGEFKIGSIYVFIVRDWGKPKLFCHRLVNITHDRLIFKGDNRNKKDNPVDPIDVLGELISSNS